MYTQLAHLYDWPGSLDFARQVLRQIQPIFAKQGMPDGGRILDLACGTGTLAIELASEGYAVTGLDLSEAMLAQAREKAAQTGVEVDWLQGDMTNFILSEPVDAVLCHYDSLNHLLSEADILNAFRAVYGALKPGGLFLFDINSLDNYETFWQGGDSYEGPNYRLLTTAEYNAESGEAQVDYVAEEHTEEGLVRREERVREQYFTEVRINALLRETGFADVELFPFNPFGEDSDLPEHLMLKTFWWCRRPAEEV